MKVIAYQVTARRTTAHPRGFRRCGRWFPVGEPVRVPLAELTPAQAEFLKSSNPRDLIVVEEFEKPAAPPAVAATPMPPADDAPAKKGRGK